MFVLLQYFAHISSLVEFDEVIGSCDLDAQIVIQLTHVLHFKVASELLLDALHLLQISSSNENIIDLICSTTNLCQFRGACFSPYKIFSNFKQNPRPLPFQVVGSCTRLLPNRLLPMQCSFFAFVKANIK